MPPATAAPEAARVSERCRGDAAATAAHVLEAEEQRVATSAVEAAQRALEENAALAARAELRKLNTSFKRPAENELKVRDSSLKKYSAFSKKLRSITKDTYASLLQELPKLNLSKYVEEVAVTIAETQLKVADISGVVQVSSLMHRTYAGFAESLLPRLLKGVAPATQPKLGAAPSMSEADPERQARLSRNRSSVLLLWELFAVNVLAQVKPLVVSLKEIISDDLATTEPLSINLPVLASLAKYLAAEPLLISKASRIAAARTSKVREAEDGSCVEAEDDAEQASLQYEARLSEIEQKAILEILRAYFDKVASNLQQSFSQLCSLERGHKKTLLSKGELSDEATATHERARKVHKRLLSGCATLAECLLEEMPNMEEEAMDKPDKMEISMVCSEAGVEELYGDLETRVFYEVMPDLRSVLPAVLFEEVKRGAAAPWGETDIAAKFDELLLAMPKMSSKQQCDDLASELCCRGLRIHCDKLVKALANPPKHLPEVLPFYGRLVATLSLVFGHIGPELVAVLDRNFRDLLERKQVHAHAQALRSCSALYLGELLKFRQISTTSYLDLVKGCLSELTPPNVFTLCALLEPPVGRFLHAREESRCDAMLEVMVRIRHTSHMPPELLAQLDRAIYTLRPPAAIRIEAAKREPMHEYITWLIHHALNKNSIDKVIRQLRKLPWDDDAIEGYWLQAMISCAEVKYYTISLVACVASGLSKFQEAAVVRFVDVCTERLRCIIDRNDARDSQSRICLSKLMGEFYAYRLLDSDSVMCLLSWILPKAAGIWGHVVPITHVPAYLASRQGAEPMARSLLHPREPILDGPEDMARLRMVCSLLDECGAYFTKGRSKRRLDCWLVYLMRYLCCKSLSTDMKFQLDKTLQALRPSLCKPSSYAAACEMVSTLEAALTKDVKHAEMLAHELLHQAPGEDKDEEELEKQMDMAEANEDQEAEDTGGEEVVALDHAEEEQLPRDLEARLPTQHAEQRERNATKEEIDDFTRKLNGVLAESRHVTQAHKASTEGLDAFANLLLRPKPAKCVATAASDQNSVSHGALKLRVMIKEGGGNKMSQVKVEATEVSVPLGDSLAKTVIRQNEQAHEERLRLKRQILATAEAQ
tara:strand:- start:112 stop:3438 length:3327 start_codon:yes stop_codon:yes gene_type:complete